MRPRSATLWLCLGYGVFVVYGSLVPLDYRPYPLERAWADFQRIPFLQLGLESRADWVANGVLYAPLGFFAARAAFAAGLPQALACALAIVAGSALAVGVEFTQLFFPPRTVSLNDIMAECIGSVVGALAAPFAATWLDRLASAWGRDGARLGLRLLELYAAGYVALCFFPYDLLLTLAEVQGKAESSNWAWWIVPSERGGLVQGLQLLVEVALAAPIGLLWARRRAAGRTELLAAALMGALLGLFIEVGQFFVESGVSQGASVLTRALGVAAGAWLSPRLGTAGFAGVRVLLRRWAPLLGLAYLPLLLVANGLFRHRWQGPDAAAASWAGVHLLPFYYHYYTTEAIALFSLGGVSLMYLPVAVLGWARAWPMAAVLAAAAVLSAAIETAKLFVVDLHPDPTNVLIAVATAALALHLIALTRRAPPVREAGAAPPVASASDTASRRGSAWWLVLVLPLVAVGALGYPVLPWALSGLLALAAAAVWRRPLLALALLPAALPALDLAPFSGRLFVDEFDLLCAVCLAVAFHRTRGSAHRTPPRLLSLAFALLALSLAASTARALWPLPALDDNSFNSYWSPYIALRIVKGAAWAWLFVSLWRRLEGAGAARARAFTAGMALGLAFTVLAVAWERAAFVGLWDFAADFRVSGPFSAMHKGGAFIECWVAVAAAFVLAWALDALRWPVRAAAALLLAGAVYAMMVTYSRNGYAALAVVVLTSLAIAAGRDRGHRAWRQAAWGLALGGLVAAVALPILLGPYARGRLARTGVDLSVRQAHWQDGLGLRDDSAWTTLVGMGPGRFPEAHYWRSQEAVHAATYRLGRDGGRHFLSLGQGATLYVEQIIPRPAPGRLELSLLLRAAQGPASVAVALCEKWILSSRHCVSATAAPAAAEAMSTPAAAEAMSTPAAAEAMSAHAASAVSAATAAPATTATTATAATAATAAPPAAQANTPAASAVPRAPWRTAAVTLDAGPLLADAAWWRPPLTLALMTPGQGSVDVTRLRLTSANGGELLANGDFAQGMDRWTFTTDVDPPWQLHSLPLTVLFDQGWLGVLAWSAVGLGCLMSGVRLAWAGQAQVPAALAALCGFLVSGSLNTLIDEPRFLWLLLVLLWLAAAPRGTGRQGRLGSLRPGLATDRETGATA